MTLHLRLITAACFALGATFVGSQGLTPVALAAMLLSVGFTLYASTAQTETGKNSTVPVVAVSTLSTVISLSALTAQALPVVVIFALAAVQLVAWCALWWVLTRTPQRTAF
ncbi:hypothetical protein VVR12_07605 [Rothia sp. LK2588]|uniref:hypothetical protein n=1 Tax=Rothia sp. LK2588 TaxID=3114369 RepID=UPI0034CF4EE2